MRFADTAGNPEVLKTLASMVDSGRVPHAIMFSEPDGGPAMGVTLAFLQYLYCGNRSGGDSCGVCPSCNRISKLIHPDVHFIFPVTAPQTSLSLMVGFRELVLANPCFTEAELGAALGIESKSALIAVAEARELLSQLSLSALEGGYRSVVIYLPEKMNQETANRLLKAIEEPEEKTQFVLITHAPEKVLQTIASRCQHIQLGAQVRAPQFERPELLDELMEALIRRDLPAALDAGEELAALPSRENAKAFCKFASDAMRNIFLVQQGVDLPPTGSGKPQEWATKVKKTFPRAAMGCFDRAYRLVDRNVNMKILFTDLVDRLNGII
ncbi:MAG: hypothetical protein J6W82_03360 [Bacteroidales bacterium]|nr:hypothetical protein [Bacteroidales bacterium]